ncbi:DUF4913 domain-containing protein [Yinghuangia sp. ASG 101]|uniref:DUF4913 domain-containing protein n=1 Tax=Yinghuangia sp. ASG 101 TaxID=2896848 RepID=UPI001E5328D1|nr:DUF4913 domain-containing protein [Yinghuangia sp. ASG 101]UGQ09023.1 DUF4913 domain-containing protein [Yinghuangia sp. ASG 101]
MTRPVHEDPWGQGIYAAQPTPRASAATPPAAPAPPVLPAGQRDGTVSATRLFDSVEQFVHEYLARIICRRLGQGTAMWCPEWWRHDEAVIRFDCLWRAFEFFVTDTETGVSTWWLHHADPHLRALLDPDYGPFALCDPEDGHATYPIGPLPVREAPAETWDNPLLRVTSRRHAWE